tara:strand:+ start:562 stop:1566 length:1005 start_codon:yes stop_codon:yes gene_type:complete
LNFKEIIKSIENRNFLPIYFLNGENTYFIDKISEKILDSVLEESEKDFNQTIFYGKDTSVESILDASKRYPVMASVQLIVVKEAQHLSRNLNQFEQYFKKPVPTTILVFCFRGKKLDKRKAIGKLLSKSNFLFDFDLVKDYQLPDWILSCAKTNNLILDSKAVVLLSEFLGNDLSEIEKNIQKLKLLVVEGQTVDIEMVQKHIGFSKDFNLFELTDAIAAMNVQKAGFIAYHFGKNSKNHPLVLTIGHLYGFFTKLMKFHFYVDKLGDNQLAGKIGVHPFFLKQYKQASKFYSKSKLAQNLSFLRHYDLMSKGVFSQTTSQDEILKEMIFKIMH